RSTGLRRGELLEERRRDVALAGVGEHDDDGAALVLGPRGDGQRPGERGARRDAAKEAFLARQAAGIVEGVVLGDGDDLVDGGAVQVLGDEARADALNGVIAGLFPGEDGGFGRLDGDDLHAGFAFFQVLADAADGAAGADAGDEDVDAAAGVLPDLDAGGLAV